MFVFAVKMFLLRADSGHQFSGRVQTLLSDCQAHEEQCVLNISRRQMKETRS